MRQRDPLSPEQARELDALERALAGDPVDDDLCEIEALVADIRATAPQMAPGFAARLEHRVSEGFPASEEHPAPRPPRRRVLFGATGVLAAAIVAVVVVLGHGAEHPPRDTALSSPPATAVAKPAESGDSAGTVTAAPPRAAEPAPTRQAAPVPFRRSSPAGAAAPSVAQAQRVPGAGGAIGAGSAPRKVQRSAELTLSVPKTKFQDAADGVVRTVDRFGGIVASSTTSSNDGSGGEADFDLRIPTGRLDDALAALSQLGHVAQRNQNLTDITGSFTSAEDRLTDARAERSGLLRALARATTQAQIDSLKARARIVRSEIARLDGQLAALRRRADLSTVTVTVRGDAAKSGAGGGSHAGWSPGDAAHDALRVLEVIAGVTLIALAIAAPLGLLAAIGLLGVRAGRRRRRESALDPA